jgi:hypothetical protein
LLHFTKLSDKYSTDEEMINDDIEGQYIDIPCLAKGVYNWMGLLDIEHVPHKKDDGPLELPHDYLPIQTKLTEAHAAKNCEFFGYEVNQKNIDKVLNRMNCIRTNIRKSIQYIIYKFWIDLANQIKLPFRTEKRAMRKMDDVMDAISSIQTYADAKKVILFNLIFF